MNIDKLLNDANPIQRQPTSKPTAEQVLARVKLANLQSVAAPPTRRRNLTMLRVAIAAIVIALVAVPLASRDTDRDNDVVLGPQYDATAAPIPSRGELLTGTYRVDGLGVELSFTGVESWVAGPTQLGHTTLFEIRNGLSEFGRLDIIRVSGLGSGSISDAGSSATFASGIDFSAWLSGVESEAAIGPILAGRVGDQESVAVTIELPASGCGNQSDCLPFATNAETSQVVLSDSQISRIWFVDGDDEAPLAIVATGDDRSIGAAERMVASMGLGTWSPHPIEGRLPWELGLSSQVPAGSVTLPLANGISFELLEESEVNQEHKGVTVAIGSRNGANVTMAVLSQAPDGSAIASAEDLTDALTGLGIALTPSATTTIDGQDAIVVGISNGPTSTGSDARFPIVENSAWIPPATGRLWVLPVEGGIFIISAGTPEPFLGFDKQIAIAQLIIDTLTFEK